MFHFLTKTHAFENPYVNWILLLVRIHAGLSIAINAGLSKVVEFPVVSWFVEDLAKAGFPFPELMAALASWGEVIGGFMLAAGILTRFSAGMAGIVMFVAAYIYQGITPIVSMHIAQSYFFIFATFFAIGGGKFSFDYWFLSKKAPKFAQAKIAMLVMAGFLIPVFSNTAFGQVKGNGNIESRTIDIAMFNKLQINFPVNATITIGQPLNVEVTTDENIFKHIGMRSDQNTFSITQDSWIKPTQMVRIHIKVPSLSALKASGYSDIFIRNVNSYELTVDNGVGDVTIEGQVDELNYLSKTGNLFAENLEAERVYARISSFGTALVNASEIIDADIPKNGKIIYVNSPESITKNPDNTGLILSRIEHKELTYKTKDLTRVVFWLKNNALKKTAIEIKGPIERPFGYGTDLLPLQKKKERFPAGTKIYQINKDGSRVLLYTVRTEDEDRTVKLFNNKTDG